MAIVQSLWSVSHNRKLTGVVTPTLNKRLQFVFSNIPCVYWGGLPHSPPYF